MTYDSDYRENTVTALETATPLTAIGADTPGQFIVPKNVSRITEVIVSLAPEATVDNIMGAASCVHLTGGLKLAEGWFPGPGFTTGGAAATTPGGGFYQPMRVQTNIPVSPGARINADAFITGEDPGAVHMGCGLVYDGVPGRIVDCDVRNIDLTTTNALVHVTERGAAVVEGDFIAPTSKIGEVFAGGAAKVTAGNDAITLAYHLSGAGLLVGGNYKFLGPTIAINDDTAISLNAVNINPFRYVCGNGIPVQVGGLIRAQGVMLEGDVGTAWSQISLGYY